MEDIQARLETCKERYFAEVGRQIHAINQAIVLVGLLMLAGIATFAVAGRAESYLKTQDQIAQENVNVSSR